MPKGFFVFLFFFFLSLAAKCCINSLAEMLIHQTLLVRNACVLSNRDCFFFWEFRCLFCDKFQVLWPQEIPHPYLVLDCHHRFRPIGYTFKTSHGWRGMIFLNYYYYFHIFIIELNSLLCFFYKRSSFGSWITDVAICPSSRRYLFSRDPCSAGTCSLIETEVIHSAITSLDFLISLTAQDFSRKLEVKRRQN